jgi:hypothetical protein
MLTQQLKPFTWLTLAFFSLAAMAQQGTITGKIYDKETGDTLIGASVQIQGTALVAFTDINGSYRFSVEPGTYILSASFTGFTTVTVEDVIVKTGETTNIEISLGVDAMQETITVTATTLQNSETGLLKFRQKAITVADAISSEEISRQGGSNAADAVSKVTGASVVGGKYVFIRGLGDRYTSTHMNGVELPSADPDVKAFQADMFPSGLLDKLVTLKTFTPDKPGNFSGGIIDIGTKEYPPEFSYGVSYSSGWLDGTTDETFITQPGGSDDWLGKDDGTRALPDFFENGDTFIPSPTASRNDDDLAQTLDSASKAFNNVMSPIQDETSLDQSVSFNIGNQFFIGERTLGFQASFSYSRKFEYFDDWELGRFRLTQSADTAGGLLRLSQFDQAEGSEKVVWGGLISGKYLLADNHEIGANFIYNQSGESVATEYAGSWDEQFANPDTVLESRLLKYTERNLESFQLMGEHYFPGADFTLKWTGANATNTQEEPDTRIFTNQYTDRVINGDLRRLYSIAQSLYPLPARYFRGLEEDSANFGIDGSLKIDIWNEQRGELKFGYAWDNKERDFTELRFEYSLSSNAERYEGDSASFFGPENMGILGQNPNTGRYSFGNVIQLAPDALGGDYNGEAEIQAFFAMAILPINDNLKMITGIRREETDYQVLRTLEPGQTLDDEDVGSLDEEDYLPSLHFIYQLGDNTNFRSAYGRTLARPTLREMAPYASFDFIADGIFLGNPDLERTLIDNFDFRWETFPQPGEIYAVSAFYKDFENPIVQTFGTAGEFGEVVFANEESATVYGAEFEARKKLAPAEATKYFSFSANLSLIESEVDIPEDELISIRALNPDASDTRELQGQSPYLFNVGLFYDDVDNDFAATLFYNVFGDRLDQVGTGGTPDAFEQSRGLLDFSASKKFWRGLSVKVSAKNLLDDPIEVLHEFNGQNFIRQSYKTGTSYSLSLSYKPQ